MIMSLYAYEDLDTSPIRYQVGQLIPDGVTTGFIWGRRTVGKTLLAINMALAIGNEVPFMGHKTNRGRTVLIAGEGFGGIGIRIKAQLLRHEQDVTAAIAEVARTRGDEEARAYAASLPPYTADNLVIMDRRFPLHFTRADKPNDQLDQVMRELTLLNTPGPGEDPETFPYITLVILDALANFKGQLSLANDSSAGRITDTMHWMAEQLQCCVMALAHPTADGRKMLGAERLGNSADFVIRIEPDEVSAPGALKTATVSCEKSKDGKEFSPFGYQVRTWKWDEPVPGEYRNQVSLADEVQRPGISEAGRPAMVTEEVTSATVELIEADEASRPGSRRNRVPGPVLASPVLREPDPPGRRVRTGLRQQPRRGLSLVPPPRAAATQADLIKGILSGECQDCHALGGGMGCNPSVPGSGIIPLSLDPVLIAHNNRILDAAIAGRVSLDDVLAWAGTLQPAAAAEQVPEPAQETADGQGDPLWWTTVRPEPRPSGSEVASHG